MHIITHTHTHSAQSELLCMCVCMHCVQGFALSVLSVHVCVSNTLLQRHHRLSLLLFPLPQRQSPNFSIACSQTERRAGGRLQERGEGKSGRVRRGSEKKTQMLSALRESPGSLSCVSQCNTTLPDKPADCADWPRWVTVRYRSVPALLTRHEINPQRFADKHLKWFRDPRG